MEHQKVGWAIPAFADHVSRGNDATHTANIIVLTWKEIDRVMRTIIGKGGMDALFHRSLETTAPAYPWLLVAWNTMQPQMDLEAMRNAFAEQDVAQFAAASDVLLLNFYQLLGNLIGLSLTERLLRPVLDPLLNGTATKDI